MIVDDVSMGGKVWEEEEEDPRDRTLVLGELGESGSTGVVGIGRRKC